MVDAQKYGAANWVDLSTPDIGAATRFYRGLFGWTVETSSTPMGEYHIGKVGGREVGGMMQAGPHQQGQPAMWTTFFYVASADDAVAKVEQCGGKVLEAPFAIPGGARVAVVADPTGAMLGLLSGGPRPEGAWMSKQPGAVCWVELLTRDPATAEAFYTAVFGWTAETRDHGGIRYTGFHLGGELVSGMMAMPSEVPAEAPSHWAVYFAVADCAATVRKSVELGGRVLHPTTDVESGRFAVLADPQGATFSVLESAGASR